MSFTSESFLFLFLPLFLALYYLTPRRFRNLTLLVESYVFYGWWRLDFLLILIGTTLWSYWAGALMMKAREEKWRDRICAIGVTGCVSVLFIFKYFGFFVDSLATLIGETPESLGIHWKLLFPIGISFYVFHAISFLVDVKRGQAEPPRNIIDYASFLALFPQIMAGPILRYKDLAPQMVERRPNWDMFTEGWRRFVLGLAKKVIVADNLAKLTDHLFSLPDPTFAESWLGGAAFMMQVYFDFSGYSSMAIGLALMFGFRFAENFRTPFHSRSVTEVWKRWHISLGQWLYTYVFLPLGGNKGGQKKQLRNIFLVSLVGGIWHGANWTFMFWGVWKGLFLVTERHQGWLRRDRSAWYGSFGVIFLMTIGGVMFRSVDFMHGLEMFKGMVGINGLLIRPEAAFGISREALAICFGAMVFTFFEPRLQKFGEFQPVTVDSGWSVVAANWGKALMALAIGAWAVIEIADNSYQPFLYIQF